MIIVGHWTGSHMKSDKVWPDPTDSGGVGAFVGALFTK
jgi:hypothetical protein